MLTWMKPIGTYGLIALLLTASLGLAAGRDGGTHPQREPLGATKASAIEVCNPSGQRAYLSRLRCKDGATPKFGRAGSYGHRNPPPPKPPARDGGEDDCGELCETFGPVKPGGVDQHMVDGYDVVCPDKSTFLYLDMYHCEQPPPDDAPPGFTIVPAKK